MENSTENSLELKKCSSCSCTMLIEYFKKNRCGVYQKCCNTCLNLRKKKRKEDRDQEKAKYPMNDKDIKSTKQIFLTEGENIHCKICKKSFSKSGLLRHRKTLDHRYAINVLDL